MINPVQISLMQASGSIRQVIIEPVLIKEGDKDLRSTGVFKIYKDAFGDETALFTEPLEPSKNNDSPADEINPDYLGKITFGNDGNWQFEGDLLDTEEQQQLTNYIESVKDNDSNGTANAKHNNGDTSSESDQESSVAAELKIRGTKP
jgi:hypothetical protein